MKRPESAIDAVQQVLDRVNDSIRRGVNFEWGVCFTCPLCLFTASAEYMRGTPLDEDCEKCPIEAFRPSIIGSRYECVHFVPPNMDAMLAHFRRGPQMPQAWKRATAKWLKKILEQMKEDQA